MGSQQPLKVRFTLPRSPAGILLVSILTLVRYSFATPTQDQGARRVWPDSQDRVWFSEWDAGKLGMYNPINNTWKEWELPGNSPQPYAIFVDDKDMVWLSDFGSNALVRFDPSQQKFEVSPAKSRGECAPTTWPEWRSMGSRIWN